MANNRKKYLWEVLVLLILCISHVYGQNQGTSSLQFLKIIPSSKMMSMGEAGVALANNAEAPFVNPAGLTLVDNIDVRITTVDWLLDTQIYSFSAAYSTDLYGTLGINVIRMDYGSFDETRVDLLGFVGENYNPGLTGRTFDAGVTMIGISYAKALTDRFSFGLTANYIEEDLFLEKMNTTTYNFGMVFDSKIKSLKLGISLLNLGPKVVYVKEKNTIPQTLRIGLSGNLISRSDDQNLIMSSENQNLGFAIDILKSRDDLQKVHVGFDYSVLNMINVRAGYKFNYDSEGITFGLGTIYKYFHIDYSYNDLGEYWDAAHRFTLGITY